MPTIFEQLAGEIDKLLAANAGKDATIAELREQIGEMQAQLAEARLGLSPGAAQKLLAKLTQAGGPASTESGEGAVDHAEAPRHDIVASVDVAAGMTTAVNRMAGTTTTLVHDTGHIVTVHTATGIPATVDRDAAALATSAAYAAGIPIAEAQAA